MPTRFILSSYRKLFLRMDNLIKDTQPMKHVKWKKVDRFVKGQSFSFLVYDGQKEIRWPRLFEIK